LNEELSPTALYDALPVLDHCHKPHDLAVARGQC
jgi:hypothetical protein